MTLHLLCPGKSSAGNSSFALRGCRAIEQSFVTPWLAGVNTSHFSVWFSLRSPPQLTAPTTPAGYSLLLCVSLTWTCWESFLLFLRGDKPISKAGACRAADLHHSGASESILWADAWSPRGCPVMATTSASVCSICQSCHFLVFCSHVAAHRAC